MWIERIEFIGFGNLINEKIEFSEDKLNLVVESNDYGKSTIVEAIWAVLFDYAPRSKTTADKLKGRLVRQPEVGQVFKACLDVRDQDRALRIVRDFGARTVRVFDRNKSDVEITSEFLSGPSSDDVGLKLTGLSRELFRNTCLVGQRELGSNMLGEVEDLPSLLQSLVDASGAATTSATAVSVLEATLGHFSYQGINLRVDKLVQQLEGERDVAKERLQRLGAEHESVSASASQLTRLEEEIHQIEKRSKAADYFQLCMEVAEVDSRLLKAQERALRVADLKTQLAKVSEFADFPFESSKVVEELWSKRQSRLADFKRTELELKLKEKQLDARRMEIRERWEGVNNCTVEDAQTLSSLARTLDSITAELSESRRKRDAEASRVADSGLKLDQLSGVRTALLNLDARDLDNAHAYNAMIAAARDQIRECEGTVWRTRQIMPEIQQQRKIKLSSCRNNFVLLALLFALFAGVEAWLLLANREQLHSPVTILGWIVLFGLVVCGAVNCWVWRQASVYRAKEAEQARQEEQKNSERGIELHNKIMGLEIRLDDFARKAGVASGAELMKCSQSYAAAAAQLKDLDLFDHMIDSREVHGTKLVSQIEPYFAKAERKVETITAQDGFKLADDINFYLDEVRSVESSEGSLEHHQSELRFLNDELQDMNSQLRQHLSQAKVTHPDDPDLGYPEFDCALKGFKQWECLQTELARMEQDLTADLPVSELPSVVQRLEGQRVVLWEKIEALIAICPEIASQAPPVMNQAAGAVEQPGETLDDLRKQRDELLILIRAATKNYDEQFLNTAEELEDLDRDIERIKRSRSALELARDTFQRLSEETHSHWSSQLNDISRVMLKGMDTDFESLHFDTELKLTARRKGRSEPLQPANINSQASGGTREQLHWLARMAVARYLAEKTALPIILDEPFSEADDERFASMMRFLLASVRGQHQLILFSCHQKRHQWLTEVLGDSGRGMIAQCRLEPV